MFELDISSLVADLELTKADLDQVRQLTVKAYVNEVYSETVNLAITKLASARGEYVGALKINKINNYTYELVMEGSKLAAMIENGAGSFDMKDGFGKSPKRIPTKSGGWYLTIPMLFKTTGANPRSDVPGQILPRAIYDLIRNSPTTVKDKGDEVVSTLTGKDIPKRYQPGQLTGLNATADSYIAKNSIYAGLNRTKDKATGMSNYNTFRRVSDKSDPKSWIHPGIPAYNLMGQAMENVDHLDIAETALQKFFPKSTINIKVYGQQALAMNARYNEMLENMTNDIIQQIKDLL